MNHKVGQLVEDGVIKQVADGSFEAVVDSNEREHIRSKRKVQPQPSQMNQQESMSHLRQSEVDELLDVDLGIE